MLRPAPITLVLTFVGLLGFISTGCSSKLLNSELLKPAHYKPAIMEGHALEQRVINRFTDAMVENKEQSLRTIVSTRFERKALRSKDAFKDLDMLNLPKTSLEVVESTASGDSRFETVVKEKEGETKYQFIIVRDGEKNRWVVDDVILRQQKKGTRASKSTVEVMDLLLTIREFVETWKDSDRSNVQQTFSTDLRGELEPLPDAWFSYLMQTIRSEYEGDMARRPEAQMNESDAVVKLPSKNGFILLKVVRQEDVWLVSDLEIRKRKDDNHPGSVLRQARALRTVTGFLDAYKAGDQQTLEQLTEGRFYKNAIKVGDLTSVPLPAGALAPQDSEIQSFAGQLTVMIPDEADVVRIDLTTPELTGATVEQREAQQKKETIEASFVVGGITIYNRQTQQQRNLKSAFTAPARAELFLSALAARDVAVLRELSGGEMSERIWDRVSSDILPLLPLEEIPSGQVTLINTNVRGEQTELEFQAADGRICSVTMRDENGSLKIEDMQFPDPSLQVASLKTHLELALPRIELSSAWRNKDLEGVRRQSSMDFNRLVWSNVSDVPSFPEQLPELLMQPVQSTQAGEHRAVVKIGKPDKTPIDLILIRENRSWVIDEVIIREPGGQVVELRKSLRQEIAQQFLTDPAGGIQQASFQSMDADLETDLDGEDRPQRLRGNLTMPPAASGKKLPSRGMDMTEESPKSSAAKTTKAPAAFRAGGSESLIQFGPSASRQNASKSGLTRANLEIKQAEARSEGVVPPPRIRPRSVAETVVDGGVVYFRGAGDRDQPSDDSIRPDMPKETESRGSNVGAGPFGDRSTITDPSGSPIDIPAE
ncbi:MAG: hypothetical protein ACK58L_00435 [Planctomycetota bacterium]